jgi:hypothetical protein
MHPHIWAEPTPLLFYISIYPQDNKMVLSDLGFYCRGGYGECVPSL